uniref:Calponin-homology (CH) domain-containing protein n=1 Tax=Cyprinodon variegatus TaxID=28743 RepID=A0A3Q2E459_CYPVA
IRLAGTHRSQTRTVNWNKQSSSLPESSRDVPELVFCPAGLCPDWDQWDQTKPVDNAREAMQQADDWLGIPQVITPEEIVDPNVDEHSVMTYLSQFPKAKLKPGAPLRPKLNPKKARAYGPGIEPVGNVVMKKATFTVETISAGMGEVLVYVEDPAGHREEAKVTANNDKNRTYSVVYTPKVMGMHKVTVLFAGLHISKSPFEVDIGMAQGDSSKATAQGPGLEPAGNIANKSTYFEVYTAGAGVGEVEVVIMDPAGKKNTVPCTIEDKGNSSYRCTYKPTQEGQHTIFITYAGGQISKSPFTVDVGEACNPSLCRAKGRGLQPKGLRVKETADFKVYTKGAGTGELKVTIKGPKGIEEPCKRKDLGDGVYGFEYYPTTPGTYSITITWGGQHIPRSPIEVKVGSEAGQQKVRAWGPGLEGGVVGKSADFVVEAVGEDVGTLGFSVEGPSQAKIECDDKGDGSCDVRYWPTEPGEYAVHVLNNNEDIQHSPFMAEIVSPPGKDFYPDKVKAFGPGLQSSGLAVGKPTEFTVDAKQGGKAPLKISAQDGEGNPVEVQVKDNGNGTFTCTYTPRKPLKHTVMVSWGGVNIPDSPFRMNVGAGCHPNKVKVSGPGIARTGLKAFDPTYFTVDCSEAGQGDISIGIKCSPGVVGPAEADIDFDIIRNDNDTFTVKYTPPGAGSYTIMVLFAIPMTPFRVKVDPAHDASKVKAEGPGLSRSGVELNKPTHFTVTTKGAGKANLDCSFSGATKGEAVKDFEIINNHDNTHTVKYTPVQQGPLGVAVTYGGDHIPKSPFNVAVAPTLDLSKVTVSGLGDKMTVGKDKEVTVKSKGAGGQGKVAAKVTGPSGKPVACKVRVINTHLLFLLKFKVPGLSPETSQLKFIPREAGPYQVELTYDGVPIPGSPFTPTAYPSSDPSKVRCSGPGLERAKVGETGEFVVDCTNAGPAELTIEIISDSGTEAEVHIQDNGDGTYTITYIPLYPGSYTLTIRYGGQDVPNFPARLNVEPAVDASGVRVFGPGVEGKGNGGHGNQHDVGGLTRLSLARFSAVLYSFSCLGVFREATTDFTVDARALTQSGGDHIKTLISNPSGSRTDFLPWKLFQGRNSRLGSLGLQSSLSVCSRCDPEGKPKKANIRDNHDGTYLVSYVPDMTGRYTILIKYGGDEIPYSPYRIRALPTGDASKCTVTGAGVGPTIQIGEQTVITVDAKAAGKGKVTCSVCTPEGAELDVDVVENEDGTFDIFYTAPQPGEYVICVRFGGEHIPNSPFQVTVRPSDQLIQQGQMPQYYAAQPWATDRPAGMNGLDVAGLRPFDLVIPFTIQKGEITGEVRMPSGKVAKPDITDNKDGTVTVKYAPTEAGLHEMDIKYDGIHIPGSPLQFFVDYMNSGNVSAYGPGLIHGTVNKPAVFTVDTKDAVEGGLSLAIEGPSKADISCVDNQDGTCTVSYLPVLPGDYSILVKYNDKHIPGSPFSARITDDSMRMSHLKVGSAADIPLDIGELDLSQLTASLTTPSGREEPCLLKILRNGHVGVSFVPKEIGEHLVNIKKNGRHIASSPISVMISQSEIGDASRVRVSGPGLSEARTFEPAEFIIDTRDAGYGGLSLSIEGPSKVDINTEDQEDGTCKVTYCPTEPGNYIINIKFADQHVPGSAFTVKVTGEGRMKESITRKKRAASVANVGSQCDLSLKIPGDPDRK